MNSSERVYVEHSGRVENFTFFERLNQGRAFNLQTLIFVNTTRVNVPNASVFMTEYTIVTSYCTIPGHGRAVTLRRYF